MEQLYEAEATGGGGKRVRPGKKLPILIFTTLAGTLLILYLVLCTVASLSGTFFPHTTLNGVEIGGLSTSQAADRLQKELLGRTCDIYLNDDSGDPAASVAYSALGVRPVSSYTHMASDAFALQRRDGFFGGGLVFLRSLLGRATLAADMTWDPDQLNTIAQKLSADFSYDPKGTSYEMGDDCVRVTTAKDGQTVTADDLKTALSGVLAKTGSTSVTVHAVIQPAEVLSAQEIHDAVAGQMKNAGYDAATKSITAEQTGAEFDVAEAEKLLKDADPGSVVKIPATIEHPAVTAEQLKGVLFRDKLGSATTHVGGTAARISNVKLATSTVNGTVLNCGDTFSYNNTVGKRTEAKGYQPAPAYVQGETVDEIGGGVCQPSSTLYLACLLSNLEIVQRYAHRYVPAYIAKGMDATVSWGGPDYQFRNNTDYPIRIEAVYSKGYLTMTLYGTKTDNTTVKMTNQVLSTTAWKTVHQDDPTLESGKQTVKVTPYTGYKVITFRNVYDADGKLISSKQEASSDYKVRDKLVLVGTKHTADVPVSGPGGASSGTTPETQPDTPSDLPTDGATDTPTTPTTPTGGTDGTPTDSNTGGTGDTTGDTVVNGVVFPTP